jgi:hypothetical protein
VADESERPDMFLIDDILLAPLKGIMALGVKLNDMINHELSNPDKIKEQLMKLQLQFELDEINEQEFQRQEAELLARLDDSENEEE